MAQYDHLLANADFSELLPPPKLPENFASRGVVVALDEADILASDALAILCYLLAGAYAEVPQEIQNVVLLNRRVQPVKNRLVHLSHSLEWPLAVPDDVPVTEVKVGAEPDGVGGAAGRGLADPQGVMSRGAMRHPFRPLFRRQYVKYQRLFCGSARAVKYVTLSALQVSYPPNPDAAVHAVTDVYLPDESFVPFGRTVGDGPLRLVFVGMLGQLYKGQDTLVRAVAAATRKGAEICLNIVGDGKYRGFLEHLTKREGVASLVELVRRGRAVHGTEAGEEIHEPGYGGRADLNSDQVISKLKQRIYRSGTPNQPNVSDASWSITCSPSVPAHRASATGDRCGSPYGSEADDRCQCAGGGAAESGRMRL